MPVRKIACHEPVACEEHVRLELKIVYFGAVGPEHRHIRFCAGSTGQRGLRPQESKCSWVMSFSFVTACRVRQRPPRCWSTRCRRSPWTRCAAPGTTLRSPEEYMKRTHRAKLVASAAACGRARACLWSSSKDSGLRVASVECCCSEVGFLV